MNANERSMQMRLASYKSWANTPDRSARTAAARRASHHTRFLEQARELHPNATEAEITKVADALKKAHYQQLALRSAQARRIRSTQKQTAKREQIARDLAEFDDGPGNAA